MADNQKQELSFDFSKDLKDIPKIIALLNKYNLTIKDITKSGETYNRQGQFQRGTFEATTRSGDKLILTLKGIKNEEGQLTGKIQLANYQFKQHVDLVGQATKAYLDFYTAISTNIKAFDPSKDVEINAYGINNLDKSIPKQMKDSAKLQAEQEAAIRRQIDLAAELNAIREKARREQLLEDQADYKVATETRIQEELRQKDMAAELSIARQLSDEAKKQLQLNDQTELLQQIRREVDLHAELNAVRENARRQQVLQDQADYKLIVETRIQEELRQKDMAAELSIARQLSEESRRRAQTELLRAEANAGFANQFGGIPRNATLGQQYAFQQSAAQAASFIGPDISPKRFQEIFNAVRSNSKTTFSGVELEAAQAILHAQDAYKNLGKTVVDTNKGMLLSWKSMARLFEIQVLHNMFGELITMLQQGVRDAIQFEIRIGEIISISEEAPLTFKQWAQGVRELSDLYGKDLKDVTEATYQTISNQVAKGTDALRLMNSIIKFSITSVSSVASSADLLTSAMNAYGKKQYEAEEIAASFFKTIELGRVRGEELAETYGRVLPTAAKLGISLNDVNAAIATLTLSGVKPADAVTLLNNVMLKLEKPSKAMAQLFKEWGVAGGDAALATYGFAGVLKKLETAANGSNDELADLFQNLRAIRGAIGLTGSAFDDFERNRQKISQGQQDYNAGFRAIQETPGKQLTDQLNQLKNLFTVEFGTKIVDQLASISKAIGGFVKPVREAVIAFQALLEGYVAFRVIEGGVNLATKSMKGLNTEVKANALSWASAGDFASKWGTTILTVVAYAIEKQNALFEEQLHIEEKLRGELTQTTQFMADQRLRSINQFFESLESQTNGIFSSMLQASAKTTLLVEQTLTDQEAFLKEHSESLKGVFEAYTKGVEQSLSQLESQRRKVENSIQNSAKLIAETRDDAERADFKRNLANGTPLEQVQLLSDRFKQLKKEMQTFFAQGDEESAKKRYQDALDILNQLTEIDSKYRKQAITLQNQLTKAQGTEEVKKRREELQKQIEALEAQRRQKNSTNPELSAQLSNLREALTDLNSETALSKAAENIGEANKKLKETTDILNAIPQTTADGLAKAFENSLNLFKQKSEETLKSLSAQAAQEQIKQEILKNTLNKIDSFDLLDKTGKSKFKSPQDAVKAYDTLLIRAEQNGLDRGTDAWKEAWTQRALIAKEVQTQLFADEAKLQQENLVNLKKQVERAEQELRDNQNEAVNKVKVARTNAAARIGLVGAAGAFQHDLGDSGFIEQLKHTLPLNSKAVDEDIGKANLLVDLVQRIKPLQDSFNANKSEASFNALTQNFEAIKKIIDDFNGRGIFDVILNGGDNSGNGRIAINGVEQSFTQFVDQANAALQSYKDSEKIATQVGERLAKAGQEIKNLSDQIDNLPKSSGTAIADVKKDFDSLISKIKLTQVEIGKLHGQIGAVSGQTPILPPYSFTPQVQLPSLTPTSQPGHTTNIGDIHVHVPPLTGNATIDGRAIANVVKNEMRKGTVAPLPKQESTHDQTWNTH